MAGLHLTILTPDRTLLDVGDASRVRARLVDDALLSVYPGHAPLIAETLPGPVEYDTETGYGQLNVAEGILQVTADGVTVLTSGLERGDAPVERPEGDRRFDRLARQLMMGLQAPPQPGADGEVAPEA